MGNKAYLISKFFLQAANSPYFVFIDKDLKVKRIKETYFSVIHSPKVLQWKHAGFLFSRLANLFVLPLLSNTRHTANFKSFFFLLTL